MLTVQRSRESECSVLSSISGSGSTRAPELSWDYCGGELNLSLTSSLATTFVEVEHACCKDSIIQEMEAEITKLKGELENAQLELLHFKKYGNTQIQMLNFSGANVSAIDTDSIAEDDSSDRTEGGPESQFNANASAFDDTLTNEAFQDIEPMDFVQVVELSTSMKSPGTRSQKSSIPGFSANGTVPIESSCFSDNDATQADVMDSTVESASNTSSTTNHGNEIEVNNVTNLQIENGPRRQLRKRKPKELKPKRYICDISHCKFATDVKKYFVSHKRMHAIRKRNKCKKCHRKFVCSLCGYGTNRKYALKLHERIHG